MGRHNVEVEWEDPPEQRSVYGALFDAVRENPGQWAVFKRHVQHPGGYLDKLKEGLYAGAEADEFEVRSHRTPAGVTIYIRVKDDEGAA